MAHAAESTHWYDRQGRPAYTVKAKDGSDRPATLRDARKLNLLPSVTSIIRCAAAPGLEIWKQKQVMLAALTMPRIEGESEDAYLARILEDSREQARKAAERGTAIHAAIQGAYDGEKSPGFEPYISAARDTVSSWLDKIIGNWTPERSFSCVVGFGGKVDLSCGNAVLDFKTKEFDADTKLSTWDEHAMQLAAYRYGLGMDTARCAIVYVSVTNPGLARLIEIPEVDLAKGWKCFYSLLQFYKARTGYDSSFEKALAA